MAIPKGLQLQTSGAQYDLASLSCSAMPTPVTCTQCATPILGTRFECVQCVGHLSVCWGCARTNLSAETAAEAAATR